MIRLTSSLALLSVVLLASCAQVYEEAVIVEPVVEEPVYEEPNAKAPIDEECASGDGIGGTGCPAID